MIKINKPQKPPEILLENQKKWTSDLLDAVKQYGSYSKIPGEEKTKLLKNYKHKEIQSELFKSSHMKCSFCECKPAEGGNIEVEHFAPKSLYPELAFEWDNLLPICRNCNGSKLAYDTIAERIINPSKENPEEFFDFCSLRLITSETSPDKDLSNRTLKIISNLNSSELFRARADLLNSISNFENEVHKWIEEIELSDTQLKKDNRILKLKDSLGILDDLCKDNEKYSAFTKNYVSKSKIISKAKNIVDEFLLRVSMY